MSRAIWTCPVCEHEAMAYDEIDHEGEKEDGTPCDYVVQGDELYSNYEYERNPER